MSERAKDIDDLRSDFIDALAVQYYNRPARDTDASRHVDDAGHKLAIALGARLTTSFDNT